MREHSLTDMERLGAFDEAERTFQMTEEAFNVFYELTARPVRVYLARITGDDRLADDLLQEAYYRFLRSGMSFESDDHRRHYLFRIATNLVRDRFRRPRLDRAPLMEDGPLQPAAPGNLEVQTQQRSDLQRAMAQLTQRERDLVWLAYGQGSTHREIAGTLGLGSSSIKPLLFRARRKLVKLLSR